MTGFRGHDPAWVGDDEVRWCPVWWGGHACDLPLGHDGVHQCGPDDDPCCQFDGGVNVRHWYTVGGWDRWRRWEHLWDRRESGLPFTAEWRWLPSSPGDVVQFREASAGPGDSHHVDGNGRVWVHLPPLPDPPEPPLLLTPAERLAEQAREALDRRNRE